MITVTTITPAGITRTERVRTQREAGRIVAYTLYYNTDIMAKKTATNLAMKAEQAGSLTTHGYSFTITKD